MPARWATVAIPIFWLFMTGWLIQRDLLPRLGFGAINYETVLANRAVAESAHWIIKLDDRTVGSLLTIVEPQEDGSCELVARGNLTGVIPPDPTPTYRSSSTDTFDRLALPDLQIRSRFLISSTGRLQRFSVTLAIHGLHKDLQVIGSVDGEELHLTASGIPVLEGESRIPIDPQAIVLDQFGPINRIPGLKIGKQWITRTVNPLAAFLTKTTWFGGTGSALAVIQHSVVGTEIHEWNGKFWPCYVVEHEHAHTKGKSWVRVSDGLVLRQEAPFGGSMVVFEQAPGESE